MQVDRPPTQTDAPLLDTLPDISGFGGTCPRRTRVQIDLLMLAIEALDLKTSESLPNIAEELELQGVIQNRVTLWRLRSTNPLRRYGSQYSDLSQEQAKAMVVLTCYAARRLMVLTQQLIAVQEQLQRRNLPWESSFRLSEYLERFRAHFRSRMNPKRSAVVVYNTEEKLNNLALSLLGQLLFCTGAAGPQRLWFSLFDGEVA